MNGPQGHLRGKEQTTCQPKRPLGSKTAKQWRHIRAAHAARRPRPQARGTALIILRHIRQGSFALLLALLLSPVVAQQQAQAQPTMQPAPRPDSIAVRAEATPTRPEIAARVGPSTGLPLPRFVSMAASEGYVRRGPSYSHRIDWVFNRRHMPLMVVAEHENWRRVVDRDGVGGWMHHTLLSGARSAIVERDMLPLYSRRDTGSALRARLEAGVVLSLRECDAGWCNVDAGDYRGWVPVQGLWGVGPEDSFE